MDCRMSICSWANYIGLYLLSGVNLWGFCSRNTADRKKKFEKNSRSLLTNADNALYWHCLAYSSPIEGSSDEHFLFG